VASIVAVSEEAAGSSRAAATGGIRRVGTAMWPDVLLPNGATRATALHAVEVKVVGKPYEGEPHVRFDLAGGGNQNRWVPGATP